MNTANKDLYCAPASEAVEVKLEGVVCQSGGVGAPDNYEPGDDPIAF